MLTIRFFLLIASTVTILQWDLFSLLLLFISFRRAIEQEKTVYKEGFERLRILKPEIEHVRKVRLLNLMNLSQGVHHWIP